MLPDGARRGAARRGVQRTRRAPARAARRAARRALHPAPRAEHAEDGWRGRREPRALTRALPPPPRPPPPAPPAPAQCKLFPVPHVWARPYLYCPRHPTTPVLLAPGVPEIQSLEPSSESESAAILKFVTELPTANNNSPFCGPNSTAHYELQIKEVSTRFYPLLPASTRAARRPTEWAGADGAEERAAACARRPLPAELRACADARRAGTRRRGRWSRGSLPQRVLAPAVAPVQLAASHVGTRARTAAAQLVSSHTCGYPARACVRARTRRAGAERRRVGVAGEGDQVVRRAQEAPRECHAAPAPPHDATQRAARARRAACDSSRAALRGPARARAAPAEQKAGNVYRVRVRIVHDGKRSEWSAESAPLKHGHRVTKEPLPAEGAQQPLPGAPPAFGVPIPPPGAAP